MQNAQVVKEKQGLILTDEEIKIWNDISIYVQYKICKYKYDTDEDIKKLLNENINSYFLHQENRANKQSIWGGRIKEGELIGNNKLGKVWMSFLRMKTDTDTKTYKNIYELLEFVTDTEGKYKFNKDSVLPIEKWYANNCLFRYDSTEGDTNNSTMKNLLIELCEKEKFQMLNFLSIDVIFLY